MTDPTDPKDETDRKLGERVGQELTLRMNALKPENLEDPRKGPEDVPEHVVLPTEMTLDQKKLVTIRTQIFQDYVAMRNFARQATEDNDQETLGEIAVDIKRMTMLANLVNAMLKRTLERQGIRDRLENVEFLAGWKIAVRRERSRKALMKRDPEIDRRILLAWNQVGRKLEEISHPLYGSRFTENRKRPEPKN